MLWKILQVSVFMGILATNIEYQWTPNGLVAGIVALLGALLATAIVSKLRDLLAWRNKLLLLNQSRQERRSLGRKLLRNRGETGGDLNS